MNATDSPSQVAVIGVGRMGKHHARTYHAMNSAKLVAVVDTDTERAETIADEYGCDALGSIDELLNKYPHLDAASVAVPTRFHSDTARPLLARHIACLVEKPLAPTRSEAQALDEFAKEHNSTLQVGHTERFNPAVRAVASMDLQARFMEVDRVSPMTFRSLDVGVVMDMMIHDLDIVLMLARSPIQRVDAVGISVLGPHEDVASARVLFESGCVANITASRLALKTERKMRLFSEDAYVSLDYQRRTGVVIRQSENKQALEQIRHQIAAGNDLSDLNYSELVSVDELTMELPPGQEDQLTAELTSFLNTARAGSEPVVTAHAGYQAVDAAERVIQAIHEHRWEGLETSKL